MYNVAVECNSTDAIISSVEPVPSAMLQLFLNALQIDARGGEFLNLGSCRLRSRPSRDPVDVRNGAERAGRIACD